VRVSNWPLYIGEETLAGFRSTTGLGVEYTEDVNDNNEYFARVDERLRRGQSIDRDVVVLTDWMAARMIRLGYCTPLDDAAFPNKVNLEDDLVDVDFDPGRKFTVPWLSGLVGIGYNVERTGRDLTRVADLFDPRFKGQVTMVIEMRDTLGLLMMGEGRDPATATRADVEAACATVRRYRENGHIRAFTGNDYAEDLASGNITAAVAWSGDIQGLAADNPNLRWIAPDEGAIRFTDCMFVPSTSDRLPAAMAWMDYAYDPAVSARLVRATHFMSPVKGATEALAHIAPELAASPLVNLPEAVRARLRSFRSLNDDEERDFNRLFQQAIGA
jgi:spermidine/putrescine transport system substrate-binding protein